ncbi:MAG TPA: hypothetical protein VIN72_10885 [Lutibacter sp.]
MKHLKKLSVVLMLTTLFSVTFTSCIDNDVSPIVEAIYEAQADLIAAQANVQNAQATKLQAEASYQLALAAMANADAAYTLQEVEELKIANANAQIALDLAKAEFNITMVGLLAELDEAGAQIALDYALKYRMYANAATNLLEDKADAVYDLAYAQAQLNSSYPLYAIKALETVVANAKFQVEINEGKIAALQALIDNPNSLPAQVSAWEAEQAALAIERDLKQAEADAKYAERDNLVAGWDGEDDVRDNFIKLYETYEKESDTLNNANDPSKDFGYKIWVLQNNIDTWAAALATYAADLAAAKSAITAAETAYTGAWTALGEKDSQGASLKQANNSLFGTYFTKSGKTSAPEAIAAGATKYATPANLQQVYVNAKITTLDATAELSAYQTAFDALVATYNAAANQLAAAQLAFDTNNYAGDLLTAQNAVTTSLATGGNFKNAQDAYAAAKTAFELDPTGFTTTDGLGLHLGDNFDFGNTGISGDGFTRTFMRVGSVGEVSVGSGTYEVKSLLPTKYIYSQLAGVAAGLTIANTDAYIWEDVAGGMPITDLAATVYDPDVHTKNLETTPGGIGFVTAIDNGTKILFVEVEADDTSVSKLFTFNKATNKLGTNNFTARPFFTSGTGTVGDPYTFNSQLTFGDTDAGYDTAWDGDTGNVQNYNALTAHAALWNLKLAEFIAQNNFDLGNDLIVAAQAAYDYQKELFDNGVDNLEALTLAKDNAITAEAAAKKAVDQAWLILGKEFVAGTKTDAKKTTGTTDAWYFVNFVSGTKKLTLNSTVFNAEVTLAILEDCDAACLQGKIDVAQHDIDLMQPALDFRLAKLVEMQAQYDLYMATYVPGSSTSYANLDADLKVKYDTLSFAIFQLEQELDALDAQYDYVSDMLSWSGGTNLSDVSLQIELAILYDNSQGSYLDSLNDLEDAEDALAAALASNAEGTAYMAYLQSVVDVLNQRYLNASALAAKYKALMDAALAS